MAPPTGPVVTRHFILATAGHVDHGKSSIVHALTGIDPDRLPEEKARGITIDLGFARLDLPHPRDASTQLQVGVVDVPGHEDFVKNMVAGVGSVDLALLVVAADDLWMPQTEEHLQILEYLGVNRGIVALAKADLATRPLPELIAEIKPRVAGTFLAAAPVIPVSVRAGAGLGELRHAIASHLADGPPRRDSGKPRLPVDRVFSLKGIGTVVTGSLAGGTLSRGQSVLVQPRGLHAKIRSVQSHNHEIQTASPGTRVALNLPDCAIAAPGQPGIRRGDIITIPPLSRAFQQLDVLLVRSPRLKGNKGPARPIRHDSIIRWHFASGNSPARLFFFERKDLLPGEKSLARLRFDEPVFVLAGERFIIRDWAGQVTLAGGVVLDCLDGSTPRAHKEQLDFLHRLETRFTSAKAFIEATLERDKFHLRDSLLAYSIFSPDEINDAAGSLAAESKIILADSFALHAAWWLEKKEKTAEEILRSHASAPESIGLPLHRLPEILPGFPPELVNILVSQLVAAAFRVDQGFIHHRNHQPGLANHLAPAAQRIRDLLKLKPYDPPARSELAPDNLSRQALQFLINSKEAVELNSEIILASFAFSLARQTVRDHLRRHGPSTAGQLRQALGMTRRIVIPFLEKLDKLGFTKRIGDLRQLADSHK